MGRAKERGLSLSLTQYSPHQFVTSTSQKNVTRKDVF
jgi:hypothetical protein